MLLLRNLPGIGPLEWDLSQHGWTEENTEWAAYLSEKYFGIEDADTRHWREDGADFVGGIEVFPTSADNLAILIAKWEAHFEPMRLFRDESDQFWASHGWDVSDGEGRQLEVMREMGRPLLCATLKLHPDATLAIDRVESPEEWGLKLAEEARRFKASR